MKNASRLMVASALALLAQSAGWAQVKVQSVPRAQAPTTAQTAPIAQAWSASPPPTAYSRA